MKEAANFGAKFKSKHADVVFSVANPGFFLLLFVLFKQKF